MPNCKTHIIFRTALKKQITVYELRCKDNDRVYIGQTVNMIATKSRHKNRPNKRMGPDVLKYTPYDDHFSMRPLLVTDNSKTADELERLKIKTTGALGEGGYNVLPGAPRNSKQFYAMMKAQKKKNS